MGMVVLIDDLECVGAFGTLQHPRGNGSYPSHPAVGCPNGRELREKLRHCSLLSREQLGVVLVPVERGELAGRYLDGGAIRWALGDGVSGGFDVHGLAFQESFPDFFS